MSWIYLHPCMLSNPCRYLDESKSMRLQHTHILSKSLHHQVSTQWWLKKRKHETLQTYPLTNSILSFMFVILDTQVLFLAKLTHVGRWTQIPSGAPNSWWATSTLSNPQKFNYMITINTTTQGMLFHVREALLWVMSQSNSTRWESIKCLTKKW